MIFDGLPIMSGGGTKMSGPHFYDIYGDASNWKTLRLEGKGILTYWGGYNSNADAYLIVDIVTRSGSNETGTLEIDGVTYTRRTAATSTNAIVGNMDAKRGITTTTGYVDVAPVKYIFYEYVEITLKKSGNYGFEYYDLDADNPVTVTYA